MIAFFGVILAPFGVLLAVAGIVLIVVAARRSSEESKRVAIERAAWDAWTAQRPATELSQSADPIQTVLQIAQNENYGTFVGFGVENGEWRTAPSEQSVLILGPPRSGKTTRVIVPAVLSAAGPVVSTSTKLDVFGATAPFRAMLGSVWIFDPSGEETIYPGCKRLSWSPVRSARSWDSSLSMAKAMVDAAKPGVGGDSEYWNERAGTLLAALVFAASFGGRTIADVRRWVLHEDIVSPLSILDPTLHPLAADILEGMLAGRDATLSSVFSTAASVISAYNSEAVLRACEQPNFDPSAFAASRDTIYITAAGHAQGRLAPLIVGLLDEIRDAQYVYARNRGSVRGQPQMVWALDEIANIAPLASLPSIVSEGGGQGIQVLACFQDLSQARVRWGAAADGFLSLFAVKIVFRGIGDMPTLASLSMMVGLWDRPYRTVTRSFGQGSSQSVSASTIREPILPEAEISNIPDGHALLVGSGKWALIRSVHYLEHPSWQNVHDHAMSHSPLVRLTRDSDWSM